VLGIDVYPDNTAHAGFVGLWRMMQLSIATCWITKTTFQNGVFGTTEG
jgi:hypothetical protein